MTYFELNEKFPTDKSKKISAALKKNISKKILKFINSYHNFFIQDRAAKNEENEKKH